MPPLPKIPDLTIMGATIVPEMDFTKPEETLENIGKWGKDLWKGAENLQKGLGALGLDKMKPPK